MAQNAPADGFVLDLDAGIDANIDLYDSIQARLERVGDEFSTWAQSHWGKKVANLLDSSPGADGMDETWQPVRALGRGAFGAVGLWEKINNKGEVEDHIAIKETERREDGLFSLQRDPRVPREAILMQQLNKAEQRSGREANNILHLRSFKNFPAARRWRFYLEFAKHGDLYPLIYSYKAWDVYFPEEFLWHVFRSFARAAVIMDEGPFCDVESGEPTDWSVTHFDIKPENIYMAHPEEKGPLDMYPTIKVADFGLSELTGQSDGDNPYWFRLKGTEDYRPPEQRGFTLHWDHRPDGVRCYRKDHFDEARCIEAEASLVDPGYQFLSAHNVYAFGKLMYDMLTLALPAEFDKALEDLTTEARYYEEYGQHSIPEITTRKNPEYSLPLRTLIRECLHIKIGKRPTPQQLLQRTEAGLETAMRSRRENTKFPNIPRVYYRKNEINHMPLGNAGISMTRSLFQMVKSEIWPDPAWEPLLSARWAPQVVDGGLVDQPYDEGIGRTRPFVHAIVVGNDKPLTRSRRGVRWKPLKPKSGGLRQVAARNDGDDRDGGQGQEGGQAQGVQGQEGSKGQEESRGQEGAQVQSVQHQDQMAQGVNSGTREVDPSFDNSDAAGRIDAFEEARARQQRAMEHLAAQALQMTQAPTGPDPGPDREQVSATPSAGQQPYPGTAAARGSKTPPTAEQQSSPRPDRKQVSARLTAGQQPSAGTGTAHVHETSLAEQQEPSRPDADDKPPIAPAGQQPPARPDADNLPADPSTESRPRPSRKRKRVMGLSLDENTEVPEGHKVRGHNLRRRPN